MGVPAVPMLNPMDFVTEILVTAAVLVALIFLWQYRDRVMKVLTGDDKLHGSVLDGIWCCCFQCCGVCTGDWTRNLTMFQCCPRRLRRQNLVKVVGQLLGMSTYTVELRNIVVGDLPYDGRGDVYLSVECAVNPAMMTAVAEDQQAKVIHFPEILTVRVRNNLLEGNVRITAKRMNVFGSEDLCKVVISPMNIVHWASQTDEQDKIKRFQMKTTNFDLERETPPWILVEFGQPMEVRDIDNIRSVDTIRTATRDNQAQEFNVATYKHTYYLLDARGHAIDEPMEEDLAEVRAMRLKAVWCFHLCNCWTILIVFAYAFVRAYVWSCYRRFNWLTMAVLNNGTSEQTEPTHFPISFHDMAKIGEQCEAEVKGTGLQGVPCRPSLDQINLLCTSSQFLDGHGQPWPKAFADYGFIEDVLGENQVGIPCLPGICNVRQKLVEHEWTLIGICIGMFVSNCLLRWCMDARIRQVKARKLLDRQHQAEEFRKQKRDQQLRKNAWW